MSPTNLPTKLDRQISPEVVAPMDPETLLANLRTAVTRTTDTAEKGKFGGLVTKLEAALSNRSSAAVE
jgi:hypothetical protein